jgi:hypothetical protein
MKSNRSNAETPLTLLVSDDAPLVDEGADVARTRARGGRQPDPLAQALRSLYFAGGKASLINVWIGKAVEAIRAQDPDVTVAELERRHAAAVERFGDHRVVKLAEHWQALGRAPAVPAARPNPNASARSRTSSDIARLRRAAAELRAAEGRLLDGGQELLT